MQYTGIRKTLQATVTIKTVIIWNFGVSRGAPAEIYRLPPSNTAISLRTASDTRVNTPGLLGAVSCNYMVQGCRVYLGGSSCCCCCDCALGRSIQFLQSERHSLTPGPCSCERYPCRVRARNLSCLAGNRTPIGASRAQTQSGRNCDFPTSLFCCYLPICLVGYSFHMSIELCFPDIPIFAFGPNND